MSKIEVNTVEPQCGTTLTLGACGQTVALGSGASQTGFGRTGTVDWITTPKVTGDSPVTGVTGKGYFLNTTAGTITLNLPAGSAGDIISMADYAATWQTNNVTVSPNGSEKIGGVNSNITLSTEGQSVTFVYVDSTQGWLNTMDSTSNVRGALYVTATGGTPSSGAIVCTNYKVHTFTGPGTFCVSCAGGACGSNTVDYLVLAGGGSGGSSPANYGGGGGGAGGYRESPGTASGCYSVSPLGAAPAVALPVTATGYPITVGAGGAGLATNAGTDGNPGNNSIFSTITSTGGGGGGGTCTPAGGDGLNGGSGGGAGTCNSSGGTGNTPPFSPPQGTNGAPTPGPLHGGGGGGGATQAGAPQTSTSPGSNGKGGDGATSSITATPTARGGGGGGASHVNVGGGGQTGGTGGGTAGITAPGQNSCAAAANTGGGTGGVHGGTPSSSGQGGSGVVIIRYRFQ